MPARSIRSAGVQDLLGGLFREHGAPDHLRCDNLEFIACAAAGSAVAP